MKRHCICSPMKSVYDKSLLFMIYIFGLIISNSLVKSYPSWDTQSSITDFGRNIRQLPCVSRRTGETGVCMFAYSCAKANGTHLGTCIDRFYFGSCCKTSDADLEVSEPDNYLSNLDNDVIGPSVVTNKLQQSTTNRYGGGTSSTSGSTTVTSSTSSSARPYHPTTSNFPSSASSYRPTTQFAVSSTTVPTTSSTSRYTDLSTRPVTAAASTATIATTLPGSAGTVSSSSSSYSTTVGQSTKPAMTTTFSTVKPLVKPSSYKPPPIRDSTPATVQKPKPQTAKPTVQFSVPSSTASSGNNNNNNLQYSTGHATAKPQASTSPYTTVTSMRPLNSSVTATFSTTKPVVKPSTVSSSTHKPAASPQTPATGTPQKNKPQTAKPPAAAAKPKPSSTARPTDLPLTTASAIGDSTTASSYATRTTVNHVTEMMANLTAATMATNAGGQSQTPTVGYSSSSSSTTVTSTSPTLVTWTTLDKAPVAPSENPSKPSNINQKPSLVDSSTHPSWVKLPVETHEPNTSGAPVKESSTNGYSSTTTMPKPTIPQSPSDNDILVTSNNINAISSSTQYPSSTLSMLMSSTTTDSNEAGITPLNMSNYKDVCGRRLFPSARIVGGEKVSFGKWPWQISLRQWRTSTYLHKCGAALFNENWAVTAAHCVENVPPSDLLLRLGEHDLSLEEEPYGYEERRIQIVASHPQFDPRTFEYDLALLRFYEPVKFQPNIVPVCVPDDDYNFVGSSAYVTGWGRLYEDGPLPSVLQEVTVPVINNSVCETMYRAAGYIEHIPDIFICAGWKKGGFDSCEGDSGGPMVIQRPDKRWLLAGIISWGIGCAEPNQPGVYTRISKFRDWINQILQF